MSKRKIDEITINDVKDSDFNCVVCLDLLIEPASLMCGHNICMICADRLEEKICPMCRIPFKTIYLQKNLLLSKIIQSLHTEEYNAKLHDQELRKKYYASERWDVLNDLVIDVISDGKNESSENLEKSKDPVFLCTLQDVIEFVKKKEIEYNFTYHDEEIKLCLLEKEKSEQIIYIGDRYIGYSEDVITDKMVELDKYLSNEDLMFLLAALVKDSVSDDVESLLDRRIQKSRKEKYDISSIEEHIVNKLKNKEILL